jgi:cytochrome c556
MRRSLLIAAALVAIPIAAFAQERVPPPVPTGLTPEQIVAARQSAYILSGGAFASMKAAADSGADVRGLVFPARALARWARTLPSMFPAGTNLPGSKALPAVWSDRAGFEARAAAYAAAAQTLVEAAQAGDRAVFLQRWADVRATCSGCHDGYRSPD